MERNLHIKIAKPAIVAKNKFFLAGISGLQHLAVKIRAIIHLDNDLPAPCSQPLHARKTGSLSCRDSIFKNNQFVPIEKCGSVPGLFQTANTGLPLSQKGCRMKIIGRMLFLSITVFLFFSWSYSVSAAEVRLKETVKDSLYGCLAGGLVGVAVLAFTRRPGDHLNYMAFGAAGGAVAGAAVSVLSAPKALAELENGEVKLSVPTVIPDIGDPNSKGQRPIVITAELFRGQF
jgi:hypothetical protein